MQKLKSSGLLALLALLFTAAPLAAQYDDIYFDASQEEFAYSPFDYEEDDYDEPAPRARQYDGTDAASDYEYASRIRRFRRPVGSFNYYDPYYVDAGYYDPYWRNGFNTTLIYNTPAVSYQRVFTPYGSRIVAVNSFGFGSPYAVGGFNSFNRFNSWNSPFIGGGFNRPLGYAGFGGFNSFGGFGAPVGAFGGGGYYCPPAFGGGVQYNVANSATNINRNVTRQPRANTTSIADRIDRSNRNYGTRGGTYNGGGEKSAATGRSSSGRSSATRSRNAPTTTRSTGRGTTIDQRRTTVRPGSSRTTTPTRSTRPSTRTTAPSRTRSYTPSRSTSPSRTRSYTPSRSSTPSRSYTPSRSSSSRSSSPSRSSGSSSRSSSSRGRGGR